nr:aromatic-L-amino-acid decarboxylase [uncultured bacterium]
MRSLEISPEQFRLLAKQVCDLVADYLETIDARPVAPSVTGAETEKTFRAPLPEKALGPESLNDLQNVLRYSRGNNGRFFGYVLGSGELVGALADLLASVINQNVTAWRSSPSAVTIERTVISWLSEALGCKDFTGTLTGGGSSANLMGLAMAREAIASANEKRLSAKVTVYASEEVHMSIPKAVALLGIGRENLRLVRTDGSFHMLTEELERAITRDKDSGKTPIAVVASAGTVNTGAVDPLTQIAAIARKHNAWFHVDGAYGALAAIAARGRFQGLELADSISLDPHKWLYQPLDCGCLLYRDPDAARKAFSHTGDYTRVLSSDPIEGFAFFEESLELSRRFRALKLWLSLRYHGFEAFRKSIKDDLGYARDLAEKIVNEPELELVAPVELSAVCFRYLGAGGRSEGDLNRLNPLILKEVNKKGRVYLSNATLRAKFCLRACIVNHRTKPEDLDVVISEVLEAGRQASH